MKIVGPKVECWINKNNIDHIANCARVCYASDRQTGSAKMVENLKKNKHLSMFRHATYYFIVPRDKFPSWLEKDAYVNVAFSKNKQTVYVSINGHWKLLHDEMFHYLEPYSANEWEFLGTEGEPCIRRTMVVITQISTSRELNRVSPNNIAEQSTRYVNFGTKGGITICEPYWYKNLSRFKKWFCKVYWALCEWAYNLLLRWGLSAQDARELLPLCAATKVVYTYSLKEWKHILNLRYWGTTGKPHPNAKIVAGLVKDSLLAQGFEEFCKVDQEILQVEI